MSDNHEWAKALKPGDQAAILIGNRYETPYEIVTFSRETATLLVFNEGTIRERRARKDDLILQKSYRKVEPVTEHVRERNARYRAVRDLEGLRAEELSTFSAEHLSNLYTALLAARAEVKGRSA
jgi:hypothetical protein